MGGFFPVKRPACKLSLQLSVETLDDFPLAHPDRLSVASEEFLSRLGKFSVKYIHAISGCKADAVYVARQKAGTHGIRRNCFHN